jgi:hypothetical protein
VAVSLDLQDSSVDNAVRGLALRAYDRGAITGQISNFRLDSLRSDGIAPATGFVCSGLDKTVKMVQIDCAQFAPAPVSDASIVLHIDRLRFTDSARHGQPNDAGAIEPAAFDQGRSTVEIHLERSDITEAAAVGFFTFYVYGRPAKDVMDFGCVNPDPRGTSPDLAACRRLGYTSRGGNRIFGNSRGSKTHTKLGELALEGPGRMIAQGNYWGDIAPADGKGDALGDECHVFEWPEKPENYTDDPPPVKPVANARCELYNVAKQGNPSGIDGRFHLLTDPRPSR